MEMHDNEELHVNKNSNKTQATDSEDKAPSKKLEVSVNRTRSMQ